MSIERARETRSRSGWAWASILVIEVKGILASHETNDFLFVADTCHDSGAGAGVSTGVD